MSTRSVACDITQGVKRIVWARDNESCVCCGKWVPMDYANAHFIKRSQGGLGIPENIVTLCPKCHWQEDFGLNTKIYEDIIEHHLKRIYGANWDKSKLVYRKY